MKNYLIINFFSLKSEKMTASEVCAVIMHEIGHAFVGLETHHNLTTTNAVKNGGLAQLGEHLLCKQGVVGSIPSSSTKTQR